MKVLRDLVVLLLVVSASGLAQKMKADPTLVYIGTYTGAPGASGASGAAGASKGIYLFRLQPEGDEVFQNVTLVPLGLAAETPNPTFIELDVKRRLLFAVNEVTEGRVSAFAIDPAGKLTLLNQASSGGSGPSQLARDKDGRYLLVANGGGSVAVLPIEAAGRLGEPTAVLHGVSKSAPGVAFDPESRFAFVTDPASDTLRAYRFDAASGKLTRADTVIVSVKPGAAPRHMVFRQDGRFAYVVNEKSSTITVFAYDAAAGTLAELQTVSTLPEYFDGPNTAGELWIHRSSRWLYVANSGHNSLVQFTVDKDKGTLTYVEEQGTGGKASRFFGIEPSSKHLAISNKDSDTVLASRIDEGNGRLKPSGIFATLASPASVRFLPPAGAGSEP